VLGAKVLGKLTVRNRPPPPTDSTHSIKTQCNDISKRIKKKNLIANSNAILTVGTTVINDNDDKLKLKHISQVGKFN
jgi:hypothetical protein